MTKHYSTKDALHALLNFLGDSEDSGSGFSRAMNELAELIPAEPFSKQQLDVIFEQNAGPTTRATRATILVKAGHSEILPYAKNLLKEENHWNLKLSYAAMMAQLGDESGYQFLEDFFKLYMRKEEDLKNFDLEELVYVFEEILINERGKAMLARFCDEADYHPDWQELEQPELP